MELIYLFYCKIFNIMHILSWGNYERKKKREPTDQG